MARIELDHVSKRFGDVAAVNDVCVTIEDNEFFCFFGPPSSGKTTLLRLLLGLETPDHGEIRIDGRPASRMTPASRNLAVVFQNLALFPHMSARDNLAFPLVERGAPKPEIDRRLAEIAEKLHISHILHKRPGLLSGGERQRVAIGRALVRDAAAYLMDDPISALDARLREAMRVELKRLQREIGHTLIYVTHDQEEAMAVADRMAILEAGSIRQLGPPKDIYDSPNCHYVAALVGSPTMNFAPGVAHGGVARVAALDWTAPLALPAAGREEAIEIGFRPETVRLGEPGSGDGFDADVVSVEPLGAATVIVTKRGGLTFKAQVKGQLAPAAGSRVRLLPSLERLVCFRAADGERLATLSSSVN